MCELTGSTELKPCDRIRRGNKFILLLQKDLFTEYKLLPSCASWTYWLESCHNKTSAEQVNWLGWQYFWRLFFSGVRFEFLPGYQLTEWKISRFSSVRQDKCRNSALKEFTILSQLAALLRRFEINFRNLIFILYGKCIFTSHFNFCILL